MILTLTVSHNIFLTRDERYTLFNKKPIQVIGVSVPVWFHNGKTSEPAMEIFCLYNIIPTECSISIKHQPDLSYTLELPSKFDDTILSRKNPVILKNLLDLKDEGSEWLAFKQLGSVKKNNKDINVSHFVEMKTIEELSETIF